MNPSNFQLTAFSLAKAWLNQMRNSVILISIISPVTFATPAIEIEKNYSQFDLNIETRQQVLSANFFSDFEVVTTVAADTGQLIIQQQDFVIPFRGYFQLPMYRLYSREFKQSSSIGSGWRWAFDLRIKNINDDHLEFTDFDGRIYKFLGHGDGSFENKTAGQRVILKTTSGYSYTDQQIHYRFNDKGKLLEVIDLSGNIVKFVYQNKRLEKITLYDWADIEFKYNNKNKLIQVKLPSGGLINYRYNGEFVTDVFDQYDNHVSYEYDDNYLSIIEQATKTILEISEDIEPTVRNVSLKTLKPYQFLYRYQMHGVGQFDFTVSKVSAAESVSLLYSCVNQVCSKTDYSGATATINWHEKFTNLPVLYRSAEGRETRWQYNQAAKLISKRAADKSIARYEYDDRQWLKSEISARGTITTYEYTSEGQVSQIIRSGIQPYLFSYNEKGLIKSIRTPNGQVTIEYDMNALPVVLKFNLATLKFHYDAYYRNTQVDIDNVPALQIAYNNTGKSIIYKNLFTKKVQQLAYSNTGLPIALSMQNAGDLKFEYDANDNLIFIKTLDRNLYAFKYDHFDRLNNFTSLAKISQSFDYDTLSRLIQVANESETVIESYSYDNDGLITEEQNIEKRRISYSYDARGRLIKAQSGNLIILEIDYNADNYPVVLKRGDHLIKYLRDNLNRIKLMRIKAQPDADYRDYEFEWDAKNRLSTLRYPSGTSVGYDYDAFGRTQNISLNQHSIIRFQYEGTGRLRLDYGAGVSSKINRNLLNQISSMEVEKNDTIFKIENRFNPKGQLITSTTKINAEKLMQAALAADAINTAVKENPRANEYYTLQSIYNHDSESQLLEISDLTSKELIKHKRTHKENKVISYKFDDFARIESIDNSAWTSKYIYQFNRLVNVGGRRFSYDQSNKLISAISEDKNQKISYDPFNQIDKIESEQGGASYFRDGYAKLSHIKSADNNVFIYNYKNSRLSESRNNSIQRDYIYSPEFRAPLAFVDQIPSQDKYYLDNLFFLHSNKQESPVLITDGNGEVKNFYHYDSFGNINYAVESVFNNIGYKSNYFDPTSGLYEIGNVLNSTLYSTKDAWIFNTSMDALKMSKQFNGNKLQSVNPLSTLLNSNCSEAKDKNLMPQHSFSFSIIDLPMLVERGMNNCQDTGIIEPNDLLQKAIKIVYANPQALFKNQIYDDISSVLTLLDTISHEQVNSSGLDAFVQTAIKRQQSQDQINLYKINDDKNTHLETVNNNDEASAVNTLNQSVRTPTPGDSQSEIDNEQQSMQASPQVDQDTRQAVKPEKKRIWLTPANE